MTESDSDISRSRRRWELDREALQALLSALDPAPETAGLKYEDLRRRLINLFAWEQCLAPDQLADETLNRLARKAAEGAEIPHVDRFAFGIARLQLQEEIRRRKTQESVVREMGAASSTPPDWAMLDALQSCLDSLPSARRQLIVAYYGEDRSALAQRLGMSINTLRNRAMRIREELYRCVSSKRDEL